MQALKLKEGVYWVGAIDWNLRNFHGYLTQRGSTYNAYLIIDEKVTLIDTVKHAFAGEMIERIKTVIDPEKIDYVVSNHVEMDHSGALPEILKLAPKATIITSPNGEKGLRQHYVSDWNYKAVKTGDSVSLGKRSLQFYLTPMVHWPDNMVCYTPEEKILFPNDAFGQHIATTERFDDEYGYEIILEEAKKYYANIVLPYGKQVEKALAAIEGLDIEILATSHGIIWRKHCAKIIKAYTQWMKNKTEEKALIIFDTMWDSTRKMANAIQSVFERQNINTTMIDLKVNHISDIMTKILTAKYIIVGSPTLNSNMLPTVAGFLSYFKGLAPKNRIGMAFGSYGWGGQSIDQVYSILESCGFDMMESEKIKYIPSEAELTELKERITAEIIEKNKTNLVKT